MFSSGQECRCKLSECCLITLFFNITLIIKIKIMLFVLKTLTAPAKFEIN